MTDFEPVSLTFGGRPLTSQSAVKTGSYSCCLESFFGSSHLGRQGLEPQDGFLAEPVQPSEPDQHGPRHGRVQDLGQTEDCQRYQGLAGHVWSLYILVIFFIDNLSYSYRHY